VPRDRAGRDIALIQLLPNAMTLGSICAGVTAMRMALTGRFDAAVALLLLAALLDGVDGRLARALHSESLIGAELDSLADVINFGVAPAIVLYMFSLWQVPVIGWGAALVYVMCCVLRLARFNVADKTGASGGDTWFTGVPSPGGALLALGPMFLAGAAPHLEPPHWSIAVWMVMVGLLMVSRFPTPSLKVRVSPRSARWTLAGLCGATVLMTVYPWATLLGLDIAYLAGVGAATILRRRYLAQKEG
jgi:CDP-diacylglycerol---serine O-phosphatidyltransferase